MLTKLRVKIKFKYKDEFIANSHWLHLSFMPVPLSYNPYANTTRARIKEDVELKPRNHTVCRTGR